MRTNYAFFDKCTEADVRDWLSRAHDIEENLFDSTEDPDYHDEADLVRRLKWAWSLRRQVIAYDRNKKAKEAE